MTFELDSKQLLRTTQNQDNKIEYEIIILFYFDNCTSLLFSQFSNSLVEFSRRESYEFVAPNLVHGHVYGHSLKL